MKKNPLQFNPRHIFRAILRETTYHPDPKARTYLKEYAIDFYRRQQAKAAEDWPTWDPPEIARRETDLLRRARRFLSSTQAANNGHMLPFRRTLCLTYARKGPRRRILMRQIMAQPHSRHDKTSKLEEGESTSPSMTSRDWQPTPFFKALHNAQASVHRFFQVAKKLRPQSKFAPEIPKLTIWDRPLPGKRIQKNWQLWQSREARAVYPPLPHSEVEYIRSIAAGELTLQPVARRRAAKVPVFAPAQTLDDLQDEEGLNLLSDPPTRQRRPGRGQPHNFTPRHLQRTYAWLLLRCPMAVNPAPVPGKPDAPDIFGSASSAGPTDIFKPNGNAKKDEMVIGKKKPFIIWRHARKSVLHVQTVSGKAADDLFG
jgi:hypothetical protein